MECCESDKTDDKRWYITPTVVKVTQVEETEPSDLVMVDTENGAVYKTGITFSLQDLMVSEAIETLKRCGYEVEIIKKND